MYLKRLEKDDGDREGWWMLPFEKFYDNCFINIDKSYPWQSCIPWFTVWFVHVLGKHVSSNDQSCFFSSENLQVSRAKKITSDLARSPGRCFLFRVFNGWLKPRLDFHPGRAGFFFYQWVQQVSQLFWFYPFYSGWLHLNSETDDHHKVCIVKPRSFTWIHGASNLGVSGGEIDGCNLTLKPSHWGAKSGESEGTGMIWKTQWGRILVKRQTSQSYKMFVWLWNDDISKHRTTCSIRIIDFVKARGDLDDWWYILDTSFRNLPNEEDIFLCSWFWLAAVA